MQLRNKVLKFFSLNSLILLLICTSAVKAQDSSVSFKKFKAEGVSAVVGDFVILDSDIDKSYLELQSQGVDTKNITRCELLGKLLEDKLYAHQAKLDSILVPDVQINGQTEQQLQYLISQLGSEQKVVDYYRKENIAELRRELFEVNKNLALSRQMQDKIVQDVEVTPEEVRQFFFSIPEDERPIFGAEVEVAHILIQPEITEAVKEKVRTRLNELRRDVIENGASFSSRAVLYSKDPGTRSKGGLIPGVRKDSPLDQTFKDVAFSLLEGEVSEPFESQFGFHIIYIEKFQSLADNSFIAIIESNLSANK